MVLLAHMEPEYPTRLARLGINGRESISFQRQMSRVVSRLDRSSYHADQMLDQLKLEADKSTDLVLYQLQASLTCL